MILKKNSQINFEIYLNPIVKLILWKKCIKNPDLNLTTMTY